LLKLVKKAEKIRAYFSFFQNNFLFKKEEKR